MRIFFEAEEQVAQLVAEQAAQGMVLVGVGHTVDGNWLDFAPFAEHYVLQVKLAGHDGDTPPGYLRGATASITGALSLATATGPVPASAISGKMRIVLRDDAGRVAYVVKATLQGGTFSLSVPTNKLPSGLMRIEERDFAPVEGKKVRLDAPIAFLIYDE